MCLKIRRSTCFVQNFDPFDWLMDPAYRSGSTTELVRRQRLYNVVLRARRSIVSRLGGPTKATCLSKSNNTKNISSVAEGH